MIIKLLILSGILISLVFTGSIVFRKSIVHYNPLTWTVVEFSWYMISFVAVCVGMIELERIEKLNTYKEKEKQLELDYSNKRALLHAQAWLLKIDGKLSKEKQEGTMWFHTMKGLFDEGLYTSRWEAFLQFSRGYLFNEKGIYADPLSNKLQFSWPANTKINPDKIFLREEIRWVVDTLNSFKERKEHLARIRPEENTNYRVRYVLIVLFLVGLSLKILKIYADYRKAAPKREKQF
jgi:hypothetical protein